MHNWIIIPDVANKIVWRYQFGAKHATADKIHQCAAQINELCLTPRPIFKIHEIPIEIGLGTSDRGDWAEI